MKRYYTLSFVALASFAVALSGCNERSARDYVPDNYNTVLSIKDASIQDVELFTTGEDGVYNVNILKGGIEPSRTPSATVRAYTKEELDYFNASYGSNYTLLPAETYELSSDVINFGSSQLYALKEVKFHTTAIQKLMEENEGVKYALPLQLESASDSVNVNKNYVVLRPVVTQPSIGFADLNTQITIPSGETSGTTDFAVQVPFESPWDLDVQVEIAGDEFFGQPLSYWNLEELGFAKEFTVTIPKGQSTSNPYKITFNSNGTPIRGAKLPLRIKSVSVDGFQMPAENLYEIILTDGNAKKVSLTADMLSTNYQEPSEGPIAGLLDGDANTYFHSAWSIGTSEAHYIQVNLQNPIQEFVFWYKNRANTNGKPTVFDIMVSDNGSDWETVKTYSAANGDVDIPTASGSEYYSKLLIASKPFKYLRYVVNQTNEGAAPIYFSLAEFEMYAK